MKKYFVILFAFLLVDVLLVSILGTQADQLKFVQWYLVLIFIEVPIYGTFILYEVKKGKDNKKQ